MILQLSAICSLVAIIAAQQPPNTVRLQVSVRDPTTNNITVILDRIYTCAELTQGLQNLSMALQSLTPSPAVNSTQASINAISSQLTTCPVLTSVQSTAIQQAIIPLLTSASSISAPMFLAAFTALFYNPLNPTAVTTMAPAATMAPIIVANAPATIPLTPELQSTLQQILRNLTLTTATLGSTVTSLPSVLSGLTAFIAAPNSNTIGQLLPSVIQLISQANAAGNASLAKQATDLLTFLVTLLLSPSSTGNVINVDLLSYLISLLAKGVLNGNQFSVALNIASQPMSLSNSLVNLIPIVASTIPNVGIQNLLSGLVTLLMANGTSPTTITRQTQSIVDLVLANRQTLTTENIRNIISLLGLLKVVYPTVAATLDGQIRQLQALLPATTTTAPSPSSGGCSSTGLLSGVICLATAVVSGLLGGVPSGGTTSGGLLGVLTSGGLLGGILG